MYTKNNHCDNCMNKIICKWCDEMKSVQNEVKGVKVDPHTTPIRVSVYCDSFQEKPNSFTPVYRN